MAISKRVTMTPLLQSDTSILSTWPYNFNVTSRYWSTKHPFHLRNRQQIYFAHIGSKRRPWTMVRTLRLDYTHGPKNDQQTWQQLGQWQCRWCEDFVHQDPNCHLNQSLGGDSDLSIEPWNWSLVIHVSQKNPIYCTHTHISGTELHRPLDLGFEPWRPCAPQQVQPSQNVKKKQKRNFTAVARPTGAVTARAKLSWKFWGHATGTTQKPHGELRFTVLDLMKVLEMTNQKLQIHDNANIHLICTNETNKHFLISMSKRYD